MLNEKTVQANSSCLVINTALKTSNTLYGKCLLHLMVDSTVNNKK